MLCTLALMLSMSQAPLPVGAAVSASTLAAKKKPPRAAPARPTPPPVETSEGLDLSVPPPAAEPARAPAAVEPTPEPPPAPERAWGVASARTAGEGQHLAEASVGLPGVDLGYWHGVLPALDIGARLAVNYFQEGQLAGSQFGFRVQGQVRYRLFESGQVALGARFAPGLLVYFPPLLGARAGVILPLGATFGYQLTPSLNLSLTLDVPFWVLIGIGTAVPLLVGGGAEYFVSDHLALTVAVKLGPTVWTNGALTRFTLDAAVGVGYHL